MSTMSKEFIQKLQALKAKAESSEFKHEADAFMKKVRDLLDRHNLNMSDLNQSEENPMGEDKNAGAWRKYEGWQSNLITAVARLYDCEIIYTTRANEVKATVIGRLAARTTFHVMWPFILEQVKMRAKHLDERPQKARRQIGNALTLRIYREISKRESAPNKNGAAEGLIIISEIDDWIKNNHTDAKDARPSKASTSVQALQAANKISLAEQLRKADSQPLFLESTG